MSMRFPNSISSPIRLVLFDAFDTLITPQSAPHLQYASVARAHGLAVIDADVKSAFKQAFRTTSQEHPNYGLETNIADPDDWWRVVVKRTFHPSLHSKVTTNQYEQNIIRLSESLVTRFGTREAYHLFPDVVPTLHKLTQIKNSKGETVKVGLATNSDSRISLVLKMFHLKRFMELDMNPLPSLGRPRPGPTLSYFEKCSKPNPRFFHAAVRRASATISTDEGAQLRPEHVLYVGDQLYEDFWGATDAGLQAAWLQRDSGKESNQPWQKISGERNSEQELAFVRERTITTLEDVVEIVTQSQQEGEE